MTREAASARWRVLLVAVAGLCGAAGVALAAVAAHARPDPSLATAAQFLILHGAAAIGVAALSSSLARPQLMLAAASLMLGGVLLFSGDIALRVFIGSGLFPFAAPIGGTSLIAAWLFVFAAALNALFFLRR